MTPVLWIAGAPRSGTTWLGEIFDSHPAVAYRYQPLFSYAFKGALTERSSAREIEDFFAAVLATDDDFVLQRGAAALGARPERCGKEATRLLVMKEVRYHHLLPHLLVQSPALKLVALVRHPCAVINSFLRTPREWRDGWRAEDEWRDAPSKNGGRPEEFYGFTRWCVLTRLFERLANERPDQVRIVRYEALVRDAEAVAADLFAFAGLELGEPTRAFLWSSTAGDTAHDHGVFKSPRVVDRWKDELDGSIRDAIEAELRGTDLERYLAESA